MGLQASIRQKSPGAVWTNCITNRQALFSKGLGTALENVLQTITRLVNYIETRPEYSKMFARFYEELGPEHTA
jgi:hypothetical protein